MRHSRAWSSCRGDAVYTGSDLTEMRGHPRCGYAGDLGTSGCGVRPRLSCRGAPVCLDPSTPMTDTAVQGVHGTLVPGTSVYPGPTCKRGLGLPGSLVHGRGADTETPEVGAGSLSFCGVFGARHGRVPYSPWSYFGVCVSVARFCRQKTLLPYEEGSLVSFLNVSVAIGAQARSCVGGAIFRQV